MRRHVVTSCCLYLAVAVSVCCNSAETRLIPPETMSPLRDATPPPRELNGLAQRFRADFEDGKADGFEPTDSNAWKVVDQGGNHVYALTVRQSDYKPPQRSPSNIALVKGIDAGSVALDKLARLGWTGPATWISLETEKAEEPVIAGFEIDATRVYGKARITLFRALT